MGNECSNCVNEKADKKKQWEYENENNFQRGNNQGSRYQNSNDPYNSQIQYLPNHQRGGSMLANNNIYNNNNSLANKNYGYQQLQNIQGNNMPQSNQTFQQSIGPHNQNNQSSFQSQPNQSYFEPNGLQNNSQLDFYMQKGRDLKVLTDIDYINQNQNKSIAQVSQNQSLNGSRPVGNQSFGGQNISDKTQDKSYGNQSDFRNSAYMAPLELRGEIELENGAIYIGQWRGDMREGFGTQKWPDGAIYEGQWKQDQADGNGKFYHANGDIFEGDWKNDKANGRGKYIHKNGSIYDGEWKDDYKDGYGIETWADGSRYEGYYSIGKKHGKGKYQWSDGSSYDGNWSYNELNGFGVYTWKDGRVYKGYWRNNFMHGRGKYSWADGRYYEGEYENDKKHGFGLYVWIDKKRYEGYWYKGKQHGKGKLITPQGEEKYVLYNHGKKKEISLEEFNNISENQFITDSSNYFLKGEGDKIDTSELGLNLQEDVYQASQNRQNDWETKRPETISASENVNQNNYFKNGGSLNQKPQQNKSDDNGIFKQDSNATANRTDTIQEIQTILQTNTSNYDFTQSKPNLQSNSSTQNLNNIQQIKQNNPNQNQNQNQIQQKSNLNAQLPESKQVQNPALQQQIQKKETNNYNQVLNTLENQESQLKPPVIRNVESEQIQNSKLISSNLLETSQQINSQYDQQQQFTQPNNNSRNYSNSQNSNYKDLLQAYGKVTMPTSQQQSIFKSNGVISKNNYTDNRNSPNRQIVQKQQYVD